MVSGTMLQESDDIDVRALIVEPSPRTDDDVHSFSFSPSAMVYDLGGGTFDVTMVFSDPGRIDSIGIKGTAGDAHLGGQDFNTM